MRQGALAGTKAAAGEDPGEAQPHPAAAAGSGVWLVARRRHGLRGGAGPCGCEGDRARDGVAMGIETKGWRRCEGTRERSRGGFGRARVIEAAGPRRRWACLARLLGSLLPLSYSLETENNIEETEKKGGVGEEIGHADNFFQTHKNVQNLTNMA